MFAQVGPMRQGAAQQVRIIEMIPNDGFCAIDNCIIELPALKKPGNDILKYSDDGSEEVCR